MSTPVVSGAIALYLEKYPNASNDTIKRNIKLSASDAGFTLNRQGAGLLNVKHFLEQKPL
jgi:serine protease AprX